MLFALLLTVFVVNAASAGVIRVAKHVAKPTAKVSYKVTKAVVKGTVKATKAVVY
jgi:hypothetical protein